MLAFSRLLEGKNMNTGRDVKSPQITKKAQVIEFKSLFFLP